MHRQRIIPLLLALTVTLMGLAACTNEPEPDMQDSEEESMLEESIPDLPVYIGLPPEYTVTGEPDGMSRQYVFESEDRDITIDVTLSDDSDYRDELLSAISDRNISGVKNSFIQNLAQPEANLARLGGHEAIYVTGITSEDERVLRYVLVSDTYVIDLYGVADESSIGLLQRHLEEVIGALESEGAGAGDSNKATNSDIEDNEN